MQLAPLLDEDGQVTRILGCIQTHGTIGRQPRRFAITDVVTKELDGQPAVDREPTKVMRQSQFSEAPQSFEGSQSQIKPAKEKRSTLELVVNNT